MPSYNFAAKFEPGYVKRFEGGNGLLSQRISRPKNFICEKSKPTNSLKSKPNQLWCLQPGTLELMPMLRVRLKADGRLVEILPDGSEGPILISNGAHTPHVNGAGHSANGRFVEAAYARNVRGQTGLTQTAFAARIGVPVETVRNWEQGKRSPRGPARALLKVIEKAPEAAFAVLGAKPPISVVPPADFDMADVTTTRSGRSGRRGQRRPHSLARARHLGAARSRLRARRRAGIASRLPAHRHRRNVRQRARGGRGACAGRASNATKFSSRRKSGRRISLRANSIARCASAWRGCA